MALGHFHEHMPCTPLLFESESDALMSQTSGIKARGLVPLRAIAWCSQSPGFSLRHHMELDMVAMPVIPAEICSLDICQIHQLNTAFGFVIF